MDFSHLEYIVALAEEKNISKAADKLLITQSALSQYLMNLESGLGVPLFNRDKRMMTLTYAGEVYLDAAREILCIQKDTARLIEDMTEYTKGDISFGIGLERGIVVLPYLHPAFCDQFPKVRLSVVQNHVRTLETLTDQGYIDVSLLSLYNRETPLDHQYLCQEEMLLAIPHDHPKARWFEGKQDGCRPVADPAVFKNDRFITTKPGYETRQIIDAIFQDAGIAPEIIFQSDSNYTVFDTAIRIPALCFVPESIVNHRDPDRKNIYCSIDRDRYSWKLVAAYRKGSYLNWATQSFISVLKDTLLSLTGDSDDWSRRCEQAPCPNKRKAIPYDSGT